MVSCTRTATAIVALQANGHLITRLLCHQCANNCGCYCNQQAECLGYRTGVNALNYTTVSLILPSSSSDNGLLPDKIERHGEQLFIRSPEHEAVASLGKAGTYFQLILVDGLPGDTVVG